MSTLCRRDVTRVTCIFIRQKVARFSLFTGLADTAAVREARSGVRLAVQVQPAVGEGLPDGTLGRDVPALPRVRRGQRIGAFHRARKLRFKHLSEMHLVS